MRTLGLIFTFFPILAPNRLSRAHFTDGILIQEGSNTAALKSRHKASFHEGAPLEKKSFLYKARFTFFKLYPCTFHITLRAMRLACWIWSIGVLEHWLFCLVICTTLDFCRLPSVVCPPSHAPCSLSFVFCRLISGICLLLFAHCPLITYNH